MDAIRELVQDFDFAPSQYEALCVKYKCEAGQLYATIRRRLREAVGSL
jgi:Mor family transcriptional regulator